MAVHVVQVYLDLLLPPQARHYTICRAVLTTAALRTLLVTMYSPVVPVNLELSVKWWPHFLLRRFIITPVAPIYHVQMDL